MLFVPLPFVVALLLLILFVAARRNDESPPNRPFLALIMASAFQSVLAGLRWGYGVASVAYVAPIVAAIVPPLVYLGVSSLVRTIHRPWPLSLGLHILPAVVIVVLMAAWRDAIDVALIITYLGYAIAVLLLMRSGTDVLRLAPFEGAASVYRASIFAAVALCLSVAVDTFVYFDFAWAHGAHAVKVISVANLLALVVLSIAAAVASRSRAPVEAAEVLPQLDFVEDTETIVRVDELMQEKKLYRDANLNLDRLARKAGIPARQISAAINRAMAKNVSQYVNEYRIAESCRLLDDTDQSVTEIMLDVGFQTKSNFNREFRRITDMTPLAWREKSARSA